jgi:hypothetical protein
MRVSSQEFTQAVEKHFRAFHRFQRPVRRERSFQNQCEHWWRKHFLKSARRPEIPENFKRAQFFFLRAQKPSGFLRAMFTP